MNVDTLIVISNYSSTNGNRKISQTLPYLKSVALTHGLRLNRMKEFKLARIILANLYYQ